MASERIPRSRSRYGPERPPQSAPQCAHAPPGGVRGCVNVNKVGCRKSTFLHCGALSASAPPGSQATCARGGHVQSMGHACCPLGSEVLRYVPKTSRVPHKR
eukprot:7381603-Prymnesium_polylepis.1